MLPHQPSFERMTGMSLGTDEVPSLGCCHRPARSSSSFVGRRSISIILPFDPIHFLPRRLTFLDGTCSIVYVSVDEMGRRCICIRVCWGAFLSRLRCGALHTPTIGSSHPGRSFGSPPPSGPAVPRPKGEDGGPMVTRCNSFRSEGTKT